MKYYRFLSRNIRRSYIIYVLVYSMITYCVCLTSAISSQRLNAKIATTNTMHNITTSLDYSANLASFLSGLPDIYEYVQSETLSDVRYDAVNISKLLSVYTASAPGSLCDIAVINNATGLLTTPGGSLPIEYYAKIHGLSYEDLSAFSSSDKAVQNVFAYSASPQNTENYLAVELCIKGNSPSSHSDAYIPIIFLYNADKFVDTSNNYNDHSYMNIAVNDNSFDIYSSGSVSHALGNKTIFTLKKNTSSATVYCSYLSGRLSYFLYVNRFFELFLLLFIIIIAFVVGFSKRNINNLYAPIRNLVASFTTGSISAVDEFEYIESSINKLISEKDGFVSTLTEYEDLLRERIIFSILNRTISDDILDEAAEKLNFKASDFPLTVCIVSLNFSGNFDSRVRSDEWFAMHDSTKSILEQHLKNHLSYTLLDYGVASFLILMPYSNDVKDFLLCIFSQIESSFGIVLHGTIGVESNSLRELYKSFDSAVSLQDKFLDASGFSSVLSYEDMTNANNIPKYSLKEEEQIINHTLSCNQDAATADIVSVIENNITDNIIATDCHASLTIMLYSTISKILSIHDVSEKEMFGEGADIYSLLKNCSSPKELEDAVNKIICEIIDEIKNKKSDKKDILKQSMLDYINENYQQAISLISMSAALNLSQAYTSKQFKKLVGENFKDYLSKYRIRQAETLMRKGEFMNIYEIANAVGYENGPTFSRAFEKHTGISPSKYISNMENNKKMQASDKNQT